MELEQQSNVPVRASAHSTRSAERDIYQMVSVVLENEILKTKPGRQHSRFYTISSNPLAKLNQQNMHTWIKSKQEHLAKYMTFSQDGDNSDSDDSSSTSDED